MKLVVREALWLTGSVAVAAALWSSVKWGPSDSDVA